MTSRLSSLLAVLVLSAAGTAADLAKVDRTLRKEPAYRGKPRYCLLVFGPEAKTRVWLVQDGDALYVDRDGDGDLTGPGERVTTPAKGGAGSYAFELGDVRDGPRLHKGVMVYVVELHSRADHDEAVQTLLKKNPRAHGYVVTADVEVPGRKGAGVGGRLPQRASTVDAAGVLQFADRPADAPVLHFGGPWKVALFGRQKLTLGRDADVVLGVGTPGVGPGSTVWVDYEGVIPEGKYPTLDVVYPPRRPGEAPARERYELKKRC